MRWCERCGAREGLSRPSHFGPAWRQVKVGSRRSRGTRTDNKGRGQRPRPLPYSVLSFPARTQRRRWASEALGPECGPSSSRLARPVVWAPSPFQEGQLSVDTDFERPFDYRLEFFADT